MAFTSQNHHCILKATFLKLRTNSQMHYAAFQTSLETFRFRIMTSLTQRRSSTSISSKTDSISTVILPQSCGTPDNYSAMTCIHTWSCHSTSKWLEQHLVSWRTWQMVPVKRRPYAYGRVVTKRSRVKQWTSLLHKAMCASIVFSRQAFCAVLRYLT